MILSVHISAALEEDCHAYIGQESVPNFRSSPVDHIAGFNDEKLSNTMMLDADAKVYKDTDDLSESKEIPEEGFVHSAES